MKDNSVLTSSDRFLFPAAGALLRSARANRAGAACLRSKIEPKRSRDGQEQSGIDDRMLCRSLNAVRRKNVVRGGPTCTALPPSNAAKQWHDEFGRSRQLLIHGWPLDVTRDFLCCRITASTWRTSILSINSEMQRTVYFRPSKNTFSAVLRRIQSLSPGLRKSRPD